MQNNNYPDLSKILQPGDEVISFRFGKSKVVSFDKTTGDILCSNGVIRFPVDRYGRNYGGDPYSELQPLGSSFENPNWSEYEGPVWNGERYEKGELVAVRDLDSHAWSIATLDHIGENTVFVKITNWERTATSFIQMCKIDSLK